MFQSKTVLFNAILASRANEPPVSFDYAWDADKKSSEVSLNPARTSASATFPNNALVLNKDNLQTRGDNVYVELRVSAPPGFGDYVDGATLFGIAAEPTGYNSPPSQYAGLRANYDFRLNGSTVSNPGYENTISGESSGTIGIAIDFNNSEIFFRDASGYIDNSNGASSYYASPDLVPNPLSFSSISSEDLYLFVLPYVGGEGAGFISGSIRTESQASYSIPTGYSYLL